MSEPEHHLYYIEWNDAVTSSDGWAPVTENYQLHLCKSVGWLIKEDKDRIVLAADISDPQEEGEGVEVNRRIGIPKDWITLKRKLKAPKK